MLLLPVAVVVVVGQLPVAVVVVVVAVAVAVVVAAVGSRTEQHRLMVQLLSLLLL